MSGRIEGRRTSPCAGCPRDRTTAEDENVRIVVACTSAVRSGSVLEVLTSRGYANVKRLPAGKMAAWQTVGYPAVK